MGRSNTIEDFWSQVDVGESGECWDWRGRPDTTAGGYGKFRLKLNGVPKTWKTHQLAYVLTYGFIPKGKWVLHACGRPACCNPEHLYPGNNSMNQHDAIEHGTHWNARKTECPKGHPYTDESIADRGGRRCRVCDREWSRQQHMARLQSV